MDVASVLNLGAVIIGLSAFLGWINHRWFHLPHTIGLVIMALVASMGGIAVDAVFPSMGLAPAVHEMMDRIDFHDALMQGMLSFLLFAGALHVDLGELAKRKWAIGIMATLGVLISTGLVGAMTWAALQLLGPELPFIWCLVFGALISPTDPVAVMGILKKVRIPSSLQAKIAGESLFNDGVGVVVFAIMVAIAMGSGEGGHGTDVSVLGIAKLFIQEALGGAVLGLLAGWIAYRAMKGIDEHNLEVLITLALVMGLYALASAVHVSGPIAVVVAGLFIGNHGARFAMSPNTREHVHTFWSLLDEILNSALFLIIGLEVLALRFNGESLLDMVVVIPIVLLARLVAVTVPIRILELGPRREFTRGAIPVLTWGGLRGGISVALALSLPTVAAKETILAITYGVVVFSIIVQGLTVERLIRSRVGNPEDRPISKADPSH